MIRTLHTAKPLDTHFLLLLNYHPRHKSLIYYRALALHLSNSKMAARRWNKHNGKQLISSDCLWSSDRTAVSWATGFHFITRHLSLQKYPAYHLIFISKPAIYFCNF